MESFGALFRPPQTSGDTYELPRAAGQLRRDLGGQAQAGEGLVARGVVRAREAVAVAWEALRPLQRQGVAVVPFLTRFFFGGGFLY